MVGDFASWGGGGGLEACARALAGVSFNGTRESVLMAQENERRTADRRTPETRKRLQSTAKPAARMFLSFPAYALLPLFLFVSLRL